MHLIIILLLIYQNEAKKMDLIKLEKYNVNPKSITISGFSSGGAQAMQFHFAHSSKISRVGIFSGVPYLYGYGRIREDFYVTEPNQFNTSFAIDMAQKYESKGLLDPLENIGNSLVYIYHGKRDSTVFHGSGKVIQKLYSIFNPNMLVNLDMSSEHGMPSDNYGGPCNTLNVLNYLINNCNYNGPYEMFNYLYGGNLHKPNGTIGSVQLNQLFSFNQSEFFPSKKSPTSMDSVGFIYFPMSYLGNNSSFRLAFVLHGCAQTRQTYGDKFAKTTGFLEVAELNDIIVIFPQTKRSLFNPRNPSGCWDWMGFTGKDYATNKGMQIKVIKKMLDRVLGEDF